MAPKFGSTRRVQGSGWADWFIAPIRFDRPQCGIHGTRSGDLAWRSMSTLFKLKWPTFPYAQVALAERTTRPPAPNVASPTSPSAIAIFLFIRSLPRSCRVSLRASCGASHRGAILSVPATGSPAGAIGARRERSCGRVESRSLDSCGLKQRPVFVGKTTLRGRVTLVQCAIWTATNSRP